MNYYPEPDVEYYEDVQYNDDPALYPNSTPTAEQYHEDYYHQDNTDDMMCSSPSPPERYHSTRSRYDTNPSHHEYYEEPSYVNDTHNYVPSQLHYQQDRHPARPMHISVQPSRTSMNFQDARFNQLPGQEPFSSRKIRLRPVSELPDMYRTIFKFGVFNAVQSSCLDSILHSRENMVVSAPTGSGKTVLFELAIIKMLTEARETGQSLKCVYMAPTKALCSEKYKDWSAKFGPLGIKCCELTGDTVHVGFGKGAWGDAKNATIIVTTSEKWDSLTRNWRNNGQMLSQIQLFLVDEVHILNESRGSTLEVVVSRMKLRGSSVRFMLVSATVPNIQDLAVWIGKNDGLDSEAKIFEFGEDFRPCKLTRHVVGVPRSKNQNDFVFQRILDGKLFKVIQTYSVGKPILVFVSTRKGVFTTAEHLCKDYAEAEKMKQALPWTKPAKVDRIFHEKRLADFANVGIGVHHAGLTLDDRRTIEELYLNRILRIVVATTTLAVGVNLPAHTVIIRGVHAFQNNAVVEYSDLDVMQMMGRAGRPQFDKDGIAVILCESDLEAKYRSLAQGKTIVESSLHVNLSEHLNSEIGLGTIKSLDSAKEWLRCSFLFQRIRKSPRHYSLGKDNNQTWEDRIDDIVMQSVENLRKSELIAGADEGDDSLTSTEYGDIMSRFYIRQKTMNTILSSPEKPTMREMAYNKLRKHNDIRFEVKKVEKTSDKINLLIQAVLGGISLNHPDYRNSDSQLQLETFGVFRHLSRIARAVVEVAVVRKRGAQVKHGLELLRCFTAKAWEDRPVVLRQIESIGEKSLKVLAEHGITSIETLRRQDSLRLEILLNRRPPFGLDMLTSLRDFPLYSLKIVQQEVNVFGGKRPVEIDLLIECALVEEGSTANVKPKKPKGRYADMTAVLSLTTDMDFIDFRRIPTKVLKEAKTFEITATLEKPSQSVMVIITSESFAGVAVSKTFRPSVPPEEYPTMKTKPMTALELELQELENCPGLFEMDVDEFGNELKQDEVPQPVKGKDPSKKPKNATSAKENDDCLPLVALPTKLPNGKYRFDSTLTPLSDNMNGLLDAIILAKIRLPAVIYAMAFSCREGLDKPPKTITFEKPTSTQPTPPIKPQTTSIIYNVTLPSRPKPKPRPMKEDHTLEMLEKIHKSTNVEENLKLPQGQRLKLDPIPGSSVRPRKKIPVPDFNIEFSSIGENESSNDAGVSFKELDDDDDDLPDPSRILESRTSSKRKTSPDDPYFNSEVDALIRDIPLEQIEAMPFKQSSRPVSPPEKFSSVHKQKRPKLDERPNPTIPARKQSPLFLDISDDDDDEVETVSPVPKLTSLMTADATMDHYDLDPRHFDLVSDTPDLTMSTEVNSPSNPSSLLDDDHFVDHVAGDPEAEKCAGPLMDDDDEFAALEAWLDSSAVQIIP
ncbi:ATP-dependent DNA helicase MER3 [Stygiomarasmius scandens]|uniref:DNA 3'-5' helicase n=1 Tax=Marasmiellus scandens TaxID=2682957 RepID=A0ABR1JWX1_9AGAR